MRDGSLQSIPQSASQPRLPRIMEASVEPQPRGPYSMPIHRHRKESGPIARSKNNGRPKQARTRRGASEARLSPAVRADKQAERRSADRAPDTRTIFDWPVHGKVIARFGRQPGVEKNEGIAIAVPEG